ncbi:hypothetical protein GGP81_002129 [Salinibacter ruber]|uniref:T9SS type A sorting domain-containing protein n=1 Tax=Salinibacter ruber TaxID=146919 RepID=UPI00216A4D34|nr:T9SS type A sorting domain-containing protein [Salinibacter ruber]MCS3955598.1 hypothetical protein [Salinibacter ruber]
MTPSPPSASLPSARRRASNTGIVLIVLAVGLLLLACGRGRAQPVSCVTAIDNATVLIPDTVSVEGDASPFFSPDSLAALSPDDTCVGAESWRQAQQTAMAVAGRGPFEGEGLSDESSFRFRLYGARGEQHRDGTATFVACTRVGKALRAFCRDDGRYEDDAIYVLRTLRLGPPAPNEAPRVQALRLAAPSPNPVRDAVRIRFATPERQTVKLKLYDMLGRVVWTFGGGRVKGRHEVQADLSGLASGAYFLRLRSEGDTKTRRITVVR